MKKIIAFLLLAATMQQAISQTETFDIATYIPPKGWTKTNGNGIISYTSINTTSGGFCVIVIHVSSASLGDAQKDFKAEWKDLVVNPLNAEANPKTDIQTSADGWKAISAAAPIKIDSIDAYTILSVFSGFGKKFSVVTTLNDQSYTNEADSFLKNIKLNKTARPAIVQTNTTVSAKANEMKGQFGQVKYSAPEGWSTTKYPDGVILTPIDLQKDEVLQIWVQEPMSFSGTMEQALQKCYNETVEKIQAEKMNDVNGTNYTKEAPKLSFKGWEYIRCSGGIHMGGGNYPAEYGLDLFVIKVNGRFEKISILKSRKNCNFSAYYSSNRLKYSSDIENFLFSLQFADWNEPVVKIGHAKGDGLTGVWQGIALSVGMSSTGTILGAQYKVKQLIFFSNGQAYFGTNFPVEGLDELNTWIAAENNRRDWGTYTFSNGTGVVKLPYEDIPLRMEKGKLIITPNKTDHAFIKTNSIDGARFNGTYALSSKDFLGNETGKTPLISFTADGKFTDNGALKILNHEIVSCLNPANNAGSGTYEVKNHSILFNYTDGRKIKIAFIGNDYDVKNQSPDTLTLSFNEDVLRRQ
jgi:hypothetical protein